MFDNYGNKADSGLDRRQFLALTSAAAAGSYLAMPAAASNILGVRTALDLPLSVGFLTGSEEYESFETLPWQGRDPENPPELAVMPAERLDVGDQMLAGETVRMTVHGLYPRIPPRRAASFRETNLLVMFPPEIPGLSGAFPFVAWGLRRLPARSRGARTSFAVPLREDGGLTLALETTEQRGSVVEPRRYFTDFTVDWYDGRPKLSRGIYFLGLSLNTWQRGTRLPDPDDPIRDELCSVVVSFEAMPEDVVLAGE